MGAFPRISQIPRIDVSECIVSEDRAKKKESNGQLESSSTVDDVLDALMALQHIVYVGATVITLHKSATRLY